MLGIKHCFLPFLFLLSASSVAIAADYTPPTPGLWKDIPDVGKSPNLIDAAKFAVVEYNKQSSSKLVFVRLLEGQVWVSRMVGTVTYQFLVEAKTSTKLYKVYKCAVFEVVVPTKPKTLRSFEPVLP